MCIRDRIAHRLGIRPAKEELEDLSIRFLDPIAYREIEENLKVLQPPKRNILMKAVLQRVKNAEVTVDGASVGKIGEGYMLLLGVMNGDTKEDLSLIHISYFSSILQTVPLPAPVCPVTPITSIQDTSLILRPPS